MSPVKSLRQQSAFETPSAGVQLAVGSGPELKGEGWAQGLLCAAPVGSAGSPWPPELPQAWISCQVGCGSWSHLLHRSGSEGEVHGPGLVNPGVFWENVSAEGRGGGGASEGDSGEGQGHLDGRAQQQGRGDEQSGWHLAEEQVGEDQGTGRLRRWGWGCREGLGLIRVQMTSFPEGPVGGFLPSPSLWVGPEGPECELPRSWSDVASCVGAGLDTRPRELPPRRPAPCTFQLAAYLEQMQYLVPCERCSMLAGAPAACCPSPRLPGAVQRGSSGCGLDSELRPSCPGPLPEASCLNALEASL